MNGRALGKTVKSLEGLGRWFKWLLYNELGSKLPYQARGCTPAFSWYLQVLRICPRTTLVEIVFETPSELEKVLKAIRPAASTTLYAAVFVGFENPQYSEQTKLTFDLVLAALQTEELSDFDCIYLQDVSFDPVTPLCRPSIPLLLTEFSVEGSKTVSLANCFRALPYNSSELVDLSLATSSTYEDSNLLPILEHLGQKLRYLTVLFQWITYCPPSLPEYYHHLTPQNFLFPLEPFTKFSQLTSLVLNCFIGPSVSLLSTLSKSSPFLRDIDFEGSFWISNEAKGAILRTTSYYHSIFQEEEIVKELSKFIHLKYVHLGYLPTTAKDKYKNLKKAMENRGVQCEWELCRIEGEECYCCDEYHTDDEEW
ncbi:hypothetical protein JCM3765_003861 [Sporobolomyces pararoseus]